MSSKKIQICLDDILTQNIWAFACICSRIALCYWIISKHNLIVNPIFSMIIKVIRVAHPIQKEY
jgi:hypothetical protein